MMNTKPHPVLIALADDHTMLRQMLKNMLNEVAAFKVIYDAPNGQALLDAIEAGVQKPHICILDVSMPVMNGYDTLVALKKRWPEIKVLVLTMIDHQGNFLRMLNAGADGYMPKGEEIDDLVQAVHFLAEYGFYHNPNMATLKEFVTRKRAREGELSKVEETFLRLCATELSYKQIADAMGVSNKAVEGYRSALFARLGVKSRTGLALYALQTGIAPFGYGDSSDSG